MFAYDTALVADIEEVVQGFVREFSFECKKKTLKVNIRETKVVRTYGNLIEYPVNAGLDSRTMQEVKIGIGVDVSNDGGMNEEINHSIRDERKTTSALVSM